MITVLWNSEGSSVSVAIRIDKHWFMPLIAVWYVMFSDVIRPSSLERSGLVKVLLASACTPRGLVLARVKHIQQLVYEQYSTSVCRVQHVQQLVYEQYSTGVCRVQHVQQRSSDGRCKWLGFSGFWETLLKKMRWYCPSVHGVQGGNCAKCSATVTVQRNSEGSFLSICIDKYWYMPLIAVWYIMFSGVIRPSSLERSGLWNCQLRCTLLKSVSSMASSFLNVRRPGISLQEAHWGACPASLASLISWWLNVNSSCCLLLVPSILMSH